MRRPRHDQHGRGSTSFPNRGTAPVRRRGIYRKPLAPATLRSRASPRPEPAPALTAANEASDPGLPDYAGMLAARHAAHAAELRAAIRSLPLPAGGAALDVACGDGFAAQCLAEAEAVGRVVAADLSLPLLRWAGERAGGTGMHLVAADAERLPFADAAFDLAWCGQSLMTLRGSVAALRELRRVLKPGGVAAILENDKPHEFRLPWPPRLELAVHRALADAGRLETGCVGRRVGELLCEAGLEVVARRTVAVDRRAPFAPADRAFLEAYLHDLGEAVRPHLSSEDRTAFDAHAAADGPDSLVTRAGGWSCWTDSLWLARR